MTGDPLADPSAGTENWANRTLFHCDNLPVLQGINSETVDLIATDPPFNKGRDFHGAAGSPAAGAKFRDRWSWDETVDRGRDGETGGTHPPAVMDAVNAADSIHGAGMGAYLNFMAVRLVEMRRVLKPSGSIFCHCDPTASHYLKILLDAVFGRDNFINEIVWHYKNAASGKRRFNRSHDLILWYSRSVGGYEFNRGDLLAPYQSGMTAWRYARQGKPPPPGKTPDDVVVMAALNAMDSERTGYPTQKPLALYDLLIRAASSPGDVVLDPFCGCATTVVAAERLNRRWLGIDLWEHAHQAVLDRLREELLETPGAASGRLFSLGEVVYTAEPPVRGQTAENSG